MDDSARALLDRLAADPDLARRFFADRAGFLAGEPLDPADRSALVALDGEGLAAFAAARAEPARPAEHPGVNRWATGLMAAWVCVICVILWTWTVG